MSETIQGLRKEKLIALLKEWKDSGKFKSVAAISRKYPVDPSYISQIKSGHRGFGEEAARTLETALELPKFYFEPSYPTGAIEHSDAEEGNANRIPHKKIRYAPVLNVAQAGLFSQYHDDAIADEFEPITSETHSKDAYWVVLSGNSMSPDFEPEDMILIEPNIQPKPGDYVLALKEGAKATSFKKWRPRGFDKDTGKEYVQLIPSNPDYPVIDSRFVNFTICGVAVERKQKLR